MCERTWRQSGKNVNSLHVSCKSNIQHDNHNVMYYAFCHYIDLMLLIHASNSVFSAKQQWVLVVAVATMATNVATMATNLPMTRSSVYCPRLAYPFQWGTTFPSQPWQLIQPPPHPSKPATTTLHRAPRSSAAPRCGPHPLAAGAAWCAHPHPPTLMWQPTTSCWCRHLLPYSSRMPPDPAAPQTLQACMRLVWLMFQTTCS